ncbi:MAG TPA: universal stress protein, partial [Dehalococcoidia bacterium]|nr:universal stress protein [Dehalococcoidia bacterium]
QVALPGLSLHVARLPFLTLAADRVDNIGVSHEESRYDPPGSDGSPKKKDIEEMARLETWLRQHASMLEGQGANILEEKILTAHDRPSQVILQAGVEHGCDLIAMATHDRNLLERTFQSSVTSEVIRSAGVPVLAITPEKQSGTLDQPAIVTRLLVLLDGSAFAESVLPYVKELGLRSSLEIVLIRWLTQIHPTPSKADSILADADMLGERVELEAADEAAVVRRYWRTTLLRWLEQASMSAGKSLKLPLIQMGQVCLRNALTASLCWRLTVARACRAGCRAALPKTCFETRDVRYWLFHQPWLNRRNQTTAADFKRLSGFLHTVSTIQPYSQKESRINRKSTRTQIKLGGLV